MTWFRRIRQQLANSGLRDLLISASVFNVLVTAGVSFVVGQYTAKQQAVASVRLAEITEFSKTSQEFEELTRTYMVKVTNDEKVDPVAKEALLANIQRQYGQLRGADAYLKPERRHVVAEYRKDLVTLSATVQVADDVMSVAPVWRQLNTTVGRKNQLIAELRRAADLPVA